MDFRQLHRALGRRWKFAVVVFLLGVVSAGAMTFKTAPTYRSTAHVYFQTATKSSLGTLSVLFEGLYLTQRVDSYTALAKDPAVLQAVIDDVNPRLTRAALATKLDVASVPNTVILEITATDGDPGVARDIARAEASQIVKLATSLEKPKAIDKSVKVPKGTKIPKPVPALRVTFTGDASFQPRQVAPSVPFNLAVGALLGLLVGVAGAVLRDLFDTSIRSPEDLTDVTKSSMMVVVPFDGTVQSHPLITDESGARDRVEAFQVLRTNLQFLNLDAGRQSIVVSSAVPNEGKTVTATNLAISIAQIGHRVLLLDCDFRNPQVAQLLGLENSVGLLTVLLGKATVQESVQHHESGIHFLATGPIPPNPAEVLSTQAMRELLTTLRGMYDVVIIDAPPLVPVADPSIIAGMADGVLFVSRHGGVPANIVKQAVDRVESAGGRIVGVVLNMSPRRMADTHNFGYEQDVGDRGKARVKPRRSLRPSGRSPGVRPIRSVRRAFGSSLTWITPVLLLMFLVLIGTHSTLLAGMAVGMAAVIALLVCLDLAEAGSLLVIAAMFLAPLNDLRLGSSYVTISDVTFVLGFAVLTPTVLGNRIRIPSMFLIGLVILGTMGVIATLASPIPAVSANQVVRLLVGAFALPLFFMVWRPGTATIVRLAAAYMFGCVFSVGYGLVQGPVAGDARYIGFTYHPNYLGLSCLLGAALTPYVVANVRPNWRWIFWGAALICAYGVWISGSRAALIVLIMLGAVYPFVEGSVRAFGAVMLGVAGVVTFSGRLLQEDSNNALGRLFGSGSANGSDIERKQILATAYQQFKQHPLLGNGFDGGIGSHNIYLQVAVAVGVFGLLGYLLILWSGLRTLFWQGTNHRLAYPVLAYAAIGPLTNTLWDRLIWAVLALTFAANVSKPEDPEVEAEDNEPADEHHRILAEIRNPR